MYKHWDNLSLIIYIFMALIGVICLYYAKKREMKTSKLTKISSLPYVIWIIVWTVFASFRYIGDGIGGADSRAYINFFSKCLESSLDKIIIHFGDDKLFKLINQVVRLFTSDYHIFFIIVYGFIIYSFIKFINEFCPKKVNFIPFFLIFFVYLRGFVSLRSNLAIAFILLGIILISKKDNKKGLIMLLLSFFIHKSSLLYIMVYFFYRLYSRGFIKLKHILLLIIISSLAGIIFQNMFINFSKGWEGAYSYYASISLNRVFFDSFWKICFGQLLLLAFVIINNKSIKQEIDNGVGIDKKRINDIYTICIFDFITVPITYILNIWRGYEFLYLARLIMWGEIIYIIQSRFPKNDRKILNIFIWFVFVFWFIFRLYNTWEDSNFAK